MPRQRGGTPLENAEIFYLTNESVKKKFGKKKQKKILKKKNKKKN